MNPTRIVVAAVGLLVASEAFADKPYFGDTWSFRVGGMEQKSDTEISFTRDGRPERKLTLSDLGMDDEASTLWAGVSWQFADSWGLNLSYSSFDTSGEETASEDGNFGDIEWSVGATLDSEYDLDLYIVDLTWDFINTGETHVGVGLGLHIADIASSVRFSVTGIVNGQEVVVDSGREGTDVTAPLPNLVVRAGHRFGDSFYLGVVGGWFALKVNDIDGELLSGRASFEWRPARHFGLGVGYQYVQVDVKDDQGDETFEFDTDVHGPVLFVSVGF